MEGIEQVVVAGIAFVGDGEPEYIGGVIENGFDVRGIGVDVADHDNDVAGGEGSLFLIDEMN